MDEDIEIIDVLNPGIQNGESQGCKQPSTSFGEIDEMYICSQCQVSYHNMCVHSIFPNGDFSTVLEMLMELQVYVTEINNYLFLTPLNEAFLNLSSQLNSFQDTGEQLISQARLVRYDPYKLGIVQRDVIKLKEHFDTSQRIHKVVFDRFKYQLNENIQNNVNENCSEEEFTFNSEEENDNKISSNSNKLNETELLLEKGKKESKEVIENLINQGLVTQERNEELTNKKHS